jgi:hypothetical protein
MTFVTDPMRIQASGNRFRNAAVHRTVTSRTSVRGSRRLDAALMLIVIEFCCEACEAGEILQR